MFLDQICDASSSALLPWSDLKLRFPMLPSSRSSWYMALCNHFVTPSTLALPPNFACSPLSFPRLLPPTLLPLQYIAYYDRVVRQIVFGRVLQCSSHLGTITVEHFCVSSIPNLNSSRFMSPLLLNRCTNNCALFYSHLVPSAFEFAHKCSFILPINEVILLPQASSASKKALCLPLLLSRSLTLLKPSFDGVSSFLLNSLSFVPPIPPSLSVSEDSIISLLFDSPAKLNLLNIARALQSCQTSSFTFYTDGSVLNLSSSSLQMGVGWVLLNPSSQAPNFEFFASTVGNPSSTRAEIVSLLTALLVCP